MTDDVKGKVTERGFVAYEFADFYGKPCSLQKSSLALVDAVWLGADSGSHLLHNQPDDLPDGWSCLPRMHLTREQVSNLIPLLQHFVENGELPEPKP